MGKLFEIFGKWRISQGAIGMLQKQREFDKDMHAGILSNLAGLCMRLNKAIATS